MAPRVILGGLVLVAVLVALLTTGALDGGDGPSLEEGDVLEQELAREAAARAKARGEGPGLSSTTAVKAREAAAAEKAAEEASKASQGPTGPYEVVVIDASSFAPLEGVELRDDEDALLGATDKQGRWSIQDARNTTLTLTAAHTGYVLWRGTARPEETLEIIMHPGVSVQGVLVRGASSKPVAGASVRVWDEDLGREVVATRTDEKGIFQLGAIRPHHPLLFVVDAPNLMPWVHRAMFDVETEQPWELEMPEGNRVEGRVLGVDGKPVKEVTVWLMPPDRRPLGEVIAKGQARERRRLQPRDIMVARTASTTTDEQGRFAFEGVEPLRSWQPVVFATRRHLVRGETIRFADHGETHEVDLQLKGSATLQVTIRDGVGTNLSHAELTVFSPEGSITPGPGDTWTQGVLTLEGLTPGRLNARAHLPGRADKGGTVKVEPGAQGRIDITFPRGAAFKGIVRTKEGKPIWQALVTWRSVGTNEQVRVRTDMKGRFTFESLQATKGILTVSARDLPHTRTTYETYIDKMANTESGPQEITLENGTAVIGRFPDLEPGTLVHSVMISGRERSERPLKLDEKLAFRRDGPDADKTASFYFYVQGYPPVVVHQRAPFRSTEVRDLGGLGLEDTNPRRGRVVGPDNRPVHGAKVSIAERWSGRSVRTDAEGEFVLGQLPRRSIRLRVEGDGLTPVYVWLGIGSEFRPAVIRLKQGRTVVVRVRDRDGRPAAGFQVMARSKPKARSRGEESVTEVYATVEGHGLAKLALPDGDYEIAAFSPSNPELHAVRAVTVQPQKKNRPISVSLRLNGSIR